VYLGAEHSFFYYSSDVFLADTDVIMRMIVAMVQTNSAALPETAASLNSGNLKFIKLLAFETLFTLQNNAKLAFVSIFQTDNIFALFDGILPS